ncbi:MAG: hypothetical protein ACR2QW_03230, partial [bacterium]
RINVLPGLEGMVWKVPIDNTRHWHIVCAQIPNPIPEHILKTMRDPAPDAELLQAPQDILDGKYTLNDFPADNVSYQNMVNMHDDVTQIGQDIIYDRSTETLGRSDIAIVQLRKLWVRELNKHAAGESLTQWSFDNISRGTAV